MTEEDLENFSFKDHTYIQHYSQIRRQLNTDPHEREEMPVGTQSVKVALSTIRDNQLYTRPNGSQVRGRELKNSIMDNIKSHLVLYVDNKYLNETIMKLREDKKNRVTPYMQSKVVRN